jgi:hypothetical protein
MSQNKEPNIIIFLFYVVFIPVFFVLLLLGEQKPGTSTLWYYTKKVVIAGMVGIAWVVGLTAWAISTGN